MVTGPSFTSPTCITAYTPPPPLTLNLAWRVGLAEALEEGRVHGPGGLRRHGLVEIGLATLLRYRVQGELGDWMCAKEDELGIHRGELGQQPGHTTEDL
jgi:hypothetical protein